jgi:hypothetical protein
MYLAFFIHTDRFSECDEGRPYCENCQKRRIQCSFRTFDPALRRRPCDPAKDNSRNGPVIHVFAANQTEDTQTSSSLTLLDEQTQDVLLDQLDTIDRPRMKTVLNHFAIYTVPTLTPGKVSHAAWREILPLLATDHHFVLNGILAVGCLHSSELPIMAADKGNLQGAAAKQMNIGMSQYRTEVQNITTSNAEALFAFSTMIATSVLSTAGAECRSAIERIRATITPVEHHEKTISAWYIPSAERCALSAEFSSFWCPVTTTFEVESSNQSSSVTGGQRRFQSQQRRKNKIINFGGWRLCGLSQERSTSTRSIRFGVHSKICVNRLHSYLDCALVLSPAMAQRNEHSTGRLCCIGRYN